MGGIITPDIMELTDKPNPPQTLTPEAVLLFARHGVFFDVSSGEILDKSKANVLGKVLICIQVIWFAMQVIARLAAGYPLALIEIHTVVHVLCALVMYILWWEVSLVLFCEGCLVLLNFQSRSRKIFARLCLEVLLTVLIFWPVYPFYRTD